MNASVDSVFPEKYRILSGSALKMIAVITMLIDHIGAVLLSMYQPAQKILFTLFGREYTVYLIFRDIGRAAFPIFCFLLLEGFRHTRSRFLYGRNLLLFALLSEIPWNLMFTNTLRYERQNVFLRFSSDIWPFVPSNISRPDLRCSFSASWDCLLFPFF